MDLDRFERAVLAAFAFLEEDFGMKVEPDSPAARKRHWWVRYVTYRSDRAFARVELDDRDRAFNVLLGSLVDGEIPRYPIFLEREDEPIRWFPLWAILQGRGIAHPPFSFAEDDTLDRELAAWAAALREHAAPALAGDFDAIEASVRRVKREQARAELELADDGGDL